MQGKVTPGSRTLIPQDDKPIETGYKPSNVTSYFLSKEELAAKIASLPPAPVNNKKRARLGY